MPFFREGDRAEISRRRVQPPATVKQSRSIRAPERSDPGKGSRRAVEGLGPTACRKAHFVQPLDLRRTEQRFGRGVVPDVAAGVSAAAIERSGRSALRRTRPDRAMAREKGGSRRDARATYAAAFFKMSRAVRGLAGPAFGRAIALCAAPAALPVSARNPAAACLPPVIRRRIR